METKKPTRELSIGEIFNQTFAIYSQKFTQYLIPFLIAGAVTGILATTVYYAIPPPTLPQLPSNPTPDQIANWMPQFWSYFSAILAIAIITGIIGWIISYIAQGITIKFTADTLERGQANLQASFNYTIAKLLSLLAVSIVTGIIITIGLVALVIPGIILAIMFSLIVPTIIIENTGALKSLSRSRRLVSNRWLKTFGVLLLFYAIIGIAGIIFGLICIPLGDASTIASSILTAFLQPILPIGLTLYYYSMIARSASQELPQSMQIT